MKIYLYIGLISIFGLSNAMEKSATIMSPKEGKVDERKEKHRGGLLTALSALNLNLVYNAPKSPSSGSSTPRVRINERKNETRTFARDSNQEKGQLGPVVRKHHVKQCDRSRLDELLQEHWEFETNVADNNDDSDDNESVDDNDGKPSYHISSEEEEYLD